MIVKELMRTAIVIEKNISLSKAAKIIVSKNINSIIFMKKNKIEGIITKEDLLKNFGKKINVSKIMTKSLIAIKSTEDIEEAKELMRKNKINVLPVMEKGKLAGIVAGKDLLIAQKEGFLFE